MSSLHGPTRFGAWATPIATFAVLICTVVADTPTPAPSPAPRTSPPSRLEYTDASIREPVVALTFDDGPHPTLTPRLLDELKASGVHATFFVIGTCVEEHPEILQRAAAEGHEIGNHSWSHPNLSRMPDEGWRAQLQRTNDLIAQTIGRAPVLMRPPYGDITPYQEALIAKLFGYRVILWSVDPNDWKEPPEHTILERVLEGVKPGSIILLHDIHPTTVDTVPRLIEELRKRHYRFATVSELLALESVQPSQPPAH